MSNHLERFESAHRAISGLRDDRLKFTTDYGVGIPIEHSLSRGDLFSPNGRRIGFLTRILDEGGVPKEIRWNHIDLGPDGTLTPRASYDVVNTSLRGRTVSASRREVPKPKDSTLAVESILKAIELGIVAQENRRYERPRTSFYDTYWQ